MIGGVFEVCESYCGYVIMCCGECSFVVYVCDVCFGEVGR